MTQMALDLKNINRARLINETKVPTGKYQSVATHMIIPKVNAHSTLPMKVKIKHSHPKPNKIKSGPSLNTSILKYSKILAQGPGFGGPIYLPNLST